MFFPRKITLLITIFSLLCSFSINADGKRSSPEAVTYDARSLIINGKRELILSGSIHYTRSTQDMWGKLLSMAKEGGLNTIQTYVFWNAHEPKQGKYVFDGNYDLVKFIKMIGEQGMYAVLRVGPFIQAEWSHGGFPYWLREVTNITFRTDNEPFKQHMEKYVRFVIDKMKEEKLLAPQGGPIILAQIENEYNTIQVAFKESGTKYIQWAGNLALGLNAGVPWIMCKQKDAPGPIINTCNGRHCGDTFTGPNKPNKPSLWTENWTAQFRVFGDPPSQRAAEDIAYSVARFFSKGGSMNNYYMYHGGTNFGRTSSSFTSTRYYDEAPVDEYGLPREPKWGHLSDLHRAIKLSKKALLWGNPSVQKLGPDTEARVWEYGADCAAFLANNASKKEQTVTFRGHEYLLPPRSISILSDCKTAVYNTQTIVAQHNARNFIRSEIANKNLDWKINKQKLPSQFPLMSKEPFELYSLTKDTTDYAWYSTHIELQQHDLPMKKGLHPVIRIASLGHGLLCFVNGEYVGSAHGSKIEKSFVLQKRAPLQAGTNHIIILAYLVGLADSGPYLERRFAGPRSVTILGLNTGTLDLTVNGWGHLVGLKGEQKKIYTKEGSEKVKWKKAPATQADALTWYKAHFDAPEGDNPVAIRMIGMGKGMVWINGKSIGRYWTSYLSPLLQPTQSEYHIPRSYMKPKDNLIVVLEEEQGTNITKVEFLVVDRDTICSHVSENYPPPVKLFSKKGSIVTVEDAKPGAYLTCPDHKEIGTVEFADYGDPWGSCGTFFSGNCTTPAAKEVVEKYCLGKTSCMVPKAETAHLKKKMSCPDPNVKKKLAIQVKCVKKK
ncbi:hypothetical protein SLEP1_g30987 [Rubroshorea leprosula]|uniref:Beta-galactosidase n=1 Tax=Rubroshorea leprosula TaxID=152421 RepID=A0AAV5K206_9ROSI|nr:hypothetical protein SLEP1_g30987 [Rubroshorea leprosula]